MDAFITKLLPRGRMNNTELDLHGQGDDSFGPQLWSQFDFTLFFEHTFLTILPAALVIAASPLYLFRLFKAPVYVSGGLLARIKFAATGALLVAELTNVILWATLPIDRTRESLAAAAMTCIGALCIMALVNIEHRHSLRSSAFISLYLGITVMIDAVRSRSYLSRPGLEAIGGLAATIAALKLVIILLGELSKRDYIRDLELQLLLSREATSFRNLLQIDDLGLLGPEFSSEHLSNRFGLFWAERKHGSHSLVRASFLTLFWPFFAVVIPRLLNIGFTFSQPFLIHRIIGFISEDGPSTSARNGLIMATVLVYLGKAVSAATYNHMNSRLVTMLRGVLVSQIYQKALRVDEHVAKKSAAVTLMSTDVEGLTDGIPKFHEIWANMIEIGLGVYFLTTVVGAASAFVAIPGLVATVTALVMGKRLVLAQVSWNKEIEKRVASTSSILEQVKSIRMMGLGPLIADRLQDLREREIDISKSFRLIWILTRTTGIFCLALSPIIIITTAMYLTRFASGLKAAEVFTTLAFANLTGYPLVRLLHSYSVFVSILGCFHRIQEYLLQEERRDRRETLKEVLLRNRECAKKHNSASPKIKRPLVVQQGGSNESRSSQPLVVFANASISAVSGKRPVLKHVNMSIMRSEFAVVMGSTGCGKTTLLRAILGEKPIKGRSYVKQRRIAYCDQDPWLKDVSIEDNIIGDDMFDEDWYDTVIRACHLAEDLDQLPLGDATLVGNGGSKLSGGQRQRVALARAIYSRATLLVLDNIFSCLDKPTADAIFHRLFSSTGLLRELESTVVMTTHSVDYMKAADRILRIDGDGFVTSHPNIANALKSDGETSQLVAAKESSQPDKANLKVKPEPQDATDINAQAERLLFERRRGDSKLYLYYLASASKWKWLTWLISIILVTIAERLPDIFIRIWVDTAPTSKSWLAGYIALGISYSIVSILTFIIYYLHVVPDSSESLHRKLVDATMESSLSFLSEAKLGSILNLFSQDMSIVSQDLPVSFYLFIYSFFLILTDIGIISSASLYVVPIIPFIFALLYVIQHFYLRTSRQLRYLDLEAKTPLYSQFSEIAAGLLHIRSFGWDRQYFAQGLLILDRSQRTFYFRFCIQRWLGLVIDLIVLGIATILVSTTLCTRHQTTQGAIGLALLNLVNFGIVIRFLVGYWIDVETAIGAISRIRTYAENTPVEKDRANMSLQAGCLQSGSIQITDVTAVHGLSSSPKPVLEKINLDIKSGQKVAVIGRTGSGKSSLILTLLNFLDYTGTIKINGINIADVSRRDLRSCITTIPQDLVELPGTVRDNLIPTSSKGKKADGKMANFLLSGVLEKTGLLDFVTANGGLDATLADIGLSHGQRQLLSIARAILHKALNNTRIVLMDEAISAVDVETSQLIRKVMEELFSDCTIISVSHQPEDIETSDVVVEIDHGRVTSVKERSVGETR